MTMQRDGAVYHYTDVRGRPVLRKIRREGWEERRYKFRQQAAVYRDGYMAWKGSRGCLERYQPDWSAKAMYNLPSLLSALRVHAPVYFCEGERDCDTGTALWGWATTTNWQGAAEFNPDQAEWFTRYGSRSRIKILVDNDDAGHYAANLRRRRLVGAGVDPKRIRLYRPIDPAHKDLTDVAGVGLGLSAYERLRPSEVRERAGTYRASLRASGERISWREYQSGVAQ
ncbi:toprim domain-containing protein [Nocardioides pinisoli]|uniref:Toprim domain-containing protein n=1 Tax=Nocardioides pinisoli TaxID=2950279 RepID=A0ABT1L133_9ACTN|nr:toprim domain-containing protein [Nocardioides pinisoli]MCP3422978.1 toprim domain-containing protein [Nocardioides pinisoli]